MSLTIPAWTERHTAVALAMAAVAGTSLVGLLEAGPFPIVVAVVVAVVGVLALTVDGFGGFLVGLAAAAALIALKRVTGRWDHDAFWISTVETAALLLTGSIVGAAGARLRPAARAGASAVALDPVYGSLGLLSFDAALARLDDEVDRAARHHRPLTVVRMSIEATGEGDERRAALRAVARLLETRLRPGDVPFAVTPDELGAVLPETTPGHAWEVLGSLVDAIRDATFTLRGEQTRRVGLAGAVQIHLGMAGLRHAGETADDLVDEATDALRRSEAERT